MVFSALAIATAVWFFGAESWVDIFSLAGTYCMFIALFFKDEQLLRLLLVGNYMFWIIYTVFFWALVAAIGNIANLISTIAAIWRHRKARKQKGS